MRIEPGRGRSPRKPALGRGLGPALPLLVGTLAASGCTEAAGKRPAAQPSAPLLALGADLAPAYESPARLRYHPRQRARAHTRRTLPDGRILTAGAGGERWLYDPRTRALQAGVSLAPETLVAVLADGADYWFVGESGTGYFAPGLLAPFERSSAPPEPLVGVTAAGTTILGIDRKRTLVRSTDFGATWSAVGPENAAFVDTVLEESGNGLALSVPEALYATRDFGKTWRRLDVAPFGVMELELGSNGELSALTPLATHVLGANGAFASAPLGAKREDRELPAPPRGPDANALAEGRAVIDGARYWELARGSRLGTWELWSGTLDGTLQSQPFTKGTGCRHLRLGAFGAHLVVACFRGSGEDMAQPIELWASDSEGERFERVPGRVDASLTSFRLAVGAHGRWIASGVCPAGALGTGCTPSGVLHGPAPERPEADRKRSADGRPVCAGSTSATPSLADTAQALAFAADGATAYAVGRRTKSNRFALFVSRDAGVSFEPEELELGRIATNDDEHVDLQSSSNTRVEAVSPAEDGAVALTFVNYGRRVLVVTDESGRLLSAAAPPEGRALLGATGLRAISIGPGSRQLWESLDGGVTFHPILRLPVEVCPEGSPCDVPVRCAPHGCVVGNRLSRIGWGGQADDGTGVLPPPLRHAPVEPDRSLRAPIACTLDPRGWQPLPGVTEAAGAHDAALGAIDWYVVAEDPERASVDVLAASGGRVERIPLLAPADRPEEYAYAVIDQIEGVATVRYRMPESGAAPSTDVEVAWSNFLDARTVRTRVRHEGVLATSLRNQGPARRAEAELVSIASGGLYLRLDEHSPTLFLDGRDVLALTPPSWPKARYPARAEMARVGGTHLSLLLVGRGAGVVRATIPASRGATPKLDAFSTGMVDPTAFGLSQLVNIAYAGGVAGLYVEVQDDRDRSARAHVFPFQATGPAVGAPIAVPTQRDLGEQPAACDAERRARTPRVVAAPAHGSRHAVVVTDAVEGPRTLLTGAAVLHGTPSEPCAAAFSALLVPTESSQSARESALVIPGAAGRSVLFRVIGSREGARLEHRPMTCRFDTSVEVPSEVHRVLGVLR
ncbi:MAG TPA: hypothetical protein VKY73_14675 [Polyangiaceae bacterium]|nr:hypothetical protein [Polyangiaceae bacterium]